MRLLVLSLTLLLAASYGRCADAPGASPPTSRTLTQFKHGVIDVSVSADGKKVAAAAAWAEVREVDGRQQSNLQAYVHICDTDSGRLRQTITPTNVNNIALSPDGAIVATVVPGKITETKDTVQLWDTNTGQLLRSLEIADIPGLKQELKELLFSPDGKHIATTAILIDETKVAPNKWVSSVVQLWDAATGKAEHTWRPEKPSTAHEALAFSVDSTLLAGALVSTVWPIPWTTEGNSEVQTWDVQSGALLRTQNVSTRRMSKLAFTPEGTLLAMRQINNEIMMWDAQSGQLLHTLDGKSRFGQGIALSPDGKTLATTSLESVIRLWDVQTGQLRQVLWGHGQWMRGLCFVPGRNALVTGQISGEVTWWQLNANAAEPPQEPRLLTGAPGSFHFTQFTADGKNIIAGASNNLLLWDINKPEPLRSFGIGKQDQAQKHEDRRPIEAILSPDGQRIAALVMVMVWDEKIEQEPKLEAYLCDARDGKQIVSLPLAENINDQAGFSPDCRTLATVSDSHTVTLREFVTGKVLRSWKSTAKLYGRPQFSPDGATLALSGERELFWWNTNTGKLAGAVKTGGLLAFAPNGEPVVTGDRTAEGVVQVWRHDGGPNSPIAPILKITIGRDPWQRLSISADAKTLAVSRHRGGDLNSNDMEVRLWNLQNGQLIGTLAEPGINSHFLALSPDGKTLATPVGFSSTRLWDISRLHEGIVR